MPVPSQDAEISCTNCGAPLVADQRYCLACGHPCSPVRLAFLDVLGGEQSHVGVPTQQGWVTPGTLELTATGYVPLDARGAAGWLRRNQGLFSLLTVLVLCLVVGLLVGHWVTQNKSSGPQIVKVEGLSAAPAATTTAPTGTTGVEETATGSEKVSKKEEQQAANEVAKETKAEKAPPPKAKKVSSTTLKKLTKSSGKKHQEEINALGATPIETG